MREYGQIQSSFWADPEVQALSGEARLLACYLLTGPHSNGLGCYRLPNGYAQTDLGWSVETILKGFDELLSIGFAYRCERTFYVLIPNFLRWNPIANPKVAMARMKELEAVPHKFSHYSELLQSVEKHGAHLPPEFETLSKPFRNKNRTDPEQEPEREPERDRSLSRPSADKRRQANRSRLPADFELTPEREASLRAQVPEADPDSEFAKFRDHHSAKGSVMADWDAAWRTWCRNAAEFAGRGRKPERESTLDYNRRAAEEFIRGTA